MNPLSDRLLMTPEFPDEESIAEPETRQSPRLRHRQHRRLFVGGIASSLLILILIFGGVSVLGRSMGDSADSNAPSSGLYFEIPYGTADKIAEPGITSAIEIPTDIRFGPGDTASITIVNYDSVQHRAGPFLIGAGQTLVQRYPSAGVYPIACTVDPAESVTVTVTK